MLGRQLKWFRPSTAPALASAAMAHWRRNDLAAAEKSFCPALVASQRVPEGIDAYCELCGAIPKRNLTARLREIRVLIQIIVGAP
jgi:hypothetical protein